MWWNFSLFSACSAVFAIPCVFGVNELSVVDRICRVKDPEMEAINGRLSPLRPGVASSYTRRGETQEICFPLLP
jgi:hypothetical protein